MIYIGETIRKKKGISRYELCDSAGVPYRTIDNWENNRREPNVRQLKKVADVLNVKMEDLFDWES